MATQHEHEHTHANDADPGAEYASRDNLNEDYRTILSELSLLTTVSVLLFGFLLTNTEATGHDTRQVLRVLGMTFVAISTMIFVLPVAYHHMQFPYRDIERFKARSHRWTLVGLPLLAVGLYLSLTIAVWPLFEGWSLIAAALPEVVVGLVFVLRKGQL